MSGSESSGEELDLENIEDMDGDDEIVPMTPLQQQNRVVLATQSQSFSDEPTQSEKQRTQAPFTNSMSDSVMAARRVLATLGKRSSEKESPKMPAPTPSTENDKRGTTTTRKNTPRKGMGATQTESGMSVPTMGSGVKTQANAGSKKKTTRSEARSKQAGPSPTLIKDTKSPGKKGAKRKKGETPDSAGESAKTTKSPAKRGTKRKRSDSVKMNPENGIENGERPAGTAPRPVENPTKRLKKGPAKTTTPDREQKKSTTPKRKKNTGKLSESASTRTGTSNQRVNGVRTQMTFFKGSQEDDVPLFSLQTQSTQQGTSKLIAGDLETIEAEQGKSTVPETGSPSTKKKLGSLQKGGNAKPRRGQKQSRVKDSFVKDKDPDTQKKIVSPLSPPAKRLHTKKTKGTQQRASIAKADSSSPESGERQERPARDPNTPRSGQNRRKSKQGSIPKGPKVAREEERKKPEAKKQDQHLESSGALASATKDKSVPTAQKASRNEKDPKASESLSRSSVEKRNGENIPVVPQDRTPRASPGKGRLKAKRKSIKGVARERRALSNEETPDSEGTATQLDTSNQVTHSKEIAGGQGAPAKESKGVEKKIVSKKKGGVKRPRQTKKNLPAKDVQTQRAQEKPSEDQEVSADATADDHAKGQSTAFENQGETQEQGSAGVAMVEKEAPESSKIQAAHDKDSGDRRRQLEAPHPTRRRQTTPNRVGTGAKVRKLSGIRGTRSSPTTRVGTSPVRAAKTSREKDTGKEQQRPSVELASSSGYESSDTGAEEQSRHNGAEQVEPESPVAQEVRQEQPVVPPVRPTDQGFKVPEKSSFVTPKPTGKPRFAPGATHPPPTSYDDAQTNGKAQTGFQGSALPTNNYSLGSPCYDNVRLKKLIHTTIDSYHQRARKRFLGNLNEAFKNFHNDMDEIQTEVTREIENAVLNNLGTLRNGSARSTDRTPQENGTAAVTQNGGDKCSAVQPGPTLKKRRISQMSSPSDQPIKSAGASNPKNQRVKKTPRTDKRSGPQKSPVKTRDRVLKLFEEYADGLTSIIISARLGVGERYARRLMGDMQQKGIVRAKEEKGARGVVLYVLVDNSSVPQTPKVARSAPRVQSRNTGQKAGSASSEEYEEL